MQASLGRRDRDRRVAAGGQHEYRVEGMTEHLLPAGEHTGDAVPLRAGPGAAGRDVGHRGDLESVGQFGQVVQVHDLGDEPGAHQPDAEPARRLRSLAGRHAGTVAVAVTCAPPRPC